MRILITGAAGFVGRHLTAYLVQNEYEVWCTDRTKMDNVGISSRALLADLRDLDQITQVIKQVRPTHIFHLAGVLGNAAYETMYNVNTVGMIHLFEALRVLDCLASVMLASSSGVYGATLPEQNPIGEDCPPRPISHYGASKLAQEIVGRQYYHAYQLPILITRTFNLLGPGLSPTLLASSLAYQIAKVELGQSNDPILVGNLLPRRDYVDVRDAVRAYIALMTAGQPGLVYNVCAGRSYSVQDCLNVLLNLAHQPVQVRQDSSRMRPMDIVDQIGDPSRIYEATGWEATISFEQSLIDLLDNWRIMLERER